MYLVIRKNISAFCINVYNLYVAFWATFARQCIHDCTLLAYIGAVIANALLNGSRCRRHLSPGVEQAVGQGGRIPLQISMKGGENRHLPSHFSMASLPVVRLKFGEN